MLYDLAARIAPSTSGFGQRSPPIASTAIVIIYEIFVRARFAVARNRKRTRRRLLLFDLDDFASLILAAMRAGPVRAYFLVTIGALGKLRCFQRIMGTPRGRAALGVSAFGIWHASIFSLIITC